MTKPAPFAPAAAGHTAPLADRLAHFPVALFSSVMGVAGLALAWTKAHHVLGAPAELGLALRWAATALYVLLWALFLVKVGRGWPTATGLAAAGWPSDSAKPIRHKSFFMVWGLRGVARVKRGCRWHLRQ